MMFKIVCGAAAGCLLLFLVFTAVVFVIAVLDFRADYNWPGRIGK